MKGLDMFCINCGKEMEDEWSTCPYCGNDLNLSSVGKNERNFSNTRKRRVVASVLSAMVVLVVVILIFCWIKNDNKIENQASLQLTYDIGTDIEHGLLYANDKGQITNENGDVISEYFGYGITDEGYVYDKEDNICIEGLRVDEKGKLVSFELGETSQESSYEIREKQEKMQVYSNDEIINRTSEKVKERLSSGYSAVDRLYHSFSIDNAFVSYDGFTCTYTCNMTVTYSSNVFDAWGTSSSSYDVIATYEDTGSTLVATGFSLF